MKTIEKRKTFDFTQGDIALPLIAFAIPMLLGNILQQTYSIFDSIVVGRFIGKEALASIGASNPITRLSIALVIFTLWKPNISIIGSYLFGALYIAAFAFGNISFTGREVLKMLPYVITIIVLIITSKE